MNVSSIGIQTILAGSGIQRQSPVADTGSERDSGRITPSAPIQASPPPDVGQVFDKTV
jgi:hypothetical protein